MAVRGGEEVPRRVRLVLTCSKHGVHGAPVPFPPMATYVLRLWLPDRPGALGAVASRVGAGGGDLVGIDILERGAGRAIDELVVELANEDWVGLLLTEVAEVDGV